MRRIAVFAAALLAALTTTAFAFQPEVSMKYGGKPAELKTESFTSLPNGDVAWRFMTADGKIAVDAVVSTTKDYPAFKTTARISNVSNEDSDVVSDLRILAKSFDLPSADAKVTIDAQHGSECVPEDFSPIQTVLSVGEEKIFETPSGRSSSEYSPFIEANADDQNGWLFATGWTGCWRARFANEGGKFSVELGMMRSQFKLHAGESILQPTTLVFERKGMSRRAFKTIVHRYMRDYNSPRDAEGAIVEPQVCLTAGGGNKTPQMMIDVLNYGLNNDLPFDLYWVDAGWYGEPHEAEPYSNCGQWWYRYAGDWQVNTTTHPTGDLLPIANAVHKAGKKFLLWFEPERVNPETPLAKTAPFDKQFGMCCFGDPESFAYMEKTIFDIVEKHHIDIYRQDFNMEPTGCWDAMEKAEGPDRIGVVEAKHIEGLYKYLDDMRAKFPWIMQENCAGGGRRVDLEMVKRAHSYCRSDYYIGPKPEDTCFNLGQDMTLNLTPYLPFQGGETNCVKNFDDYGFMSVASSGTVFTPTDLDGGIVKREFTKEETEWFKKMLGWAYRLKKYYLGDFYQLTDETYAVDDCWCAWSCDRPDEQDGFVLAFRRAKSGVDSMTFELPAIDANAQYEVENYNGEKSKMSGKDLANLVVKLDEPRSFCLLIYKKL